MHEATLLPKLLSLLADQCFRPPFDSPFWNWNLLPMRRSMDGCQPEGTRSHQGLRVGFVPAGILACFLGLYQHGTSRHATPITPHFLSANCRAAGRQGGGGGRRGLVTRAAGRQAEAGYSHLFVCPDRQVEVVHVATAPALVAGVVVGVDARAGVRDHHNLRVIRDGRKRTCISYVCLIIRM